MSELVSSAGSTLAKAAVQKLLKAVVTPSFRRKLLREMINGAPEPHPRIRLIDRLYLWRLLAAQDTPRLLLDPSAWAKRTFADDVEKAIDVHPPTGERRKLAEDLARVARERVFAVLEQAEATAALAGHLQDVAVRGAGRIHAADVSAVRQRIRSVNDRERRRCLSSGRPSTQLEPPPLRSVISDYLSQQPWHERCRRQLDVVLATVGQFPSLRDEAAMLRDVDIYATYDTVWHQLSDARDAGVFDRILMTLHRAFAEQDEALLHASSEERRAAERATAQLAATARRPAFDFCLLLVGSWGSGRTRTLAEVFSLAETAGDLAISLDLDAREPSVVDQLVQTVAQVLDIPLAGLAALDRVLSDDLEIRCLVVVDDVDQSRQRDSRVLDELQALVEQSTRFHSLRWVMASDELYVDQVAGGRRRSEFWQRYGYRQPSPPNEQLPSVGGWIDVDAANTTARLGVQILQRHVPPSLSQELQAIAWREAPLSYELHLVSNPFAGMAAPRHRELCSAAGARAIPSRASP